MLKFRHCVLMASAAVSLSACASSPDNIQASFVSPAQYEYMTCAQLADYATALNATYKQAADQQDEARAYDVIGYVVLQSPVGSQRYAGIPIEIAELKGRMAAVQSLQNSKSCSSTESASLDNGANKIATH